VFTSDASGENSLTSTLDDIFSITAPPVVDDVLSGYMATFDITVSSDDSNFVLSYEWFETGDAATVLNADTTASSFTTGQLMFDTDQNNEYSCKVTWTNGNTQILTSTSVAVGVNIENSCEVIKGLNDETTLDVMEDYVQDETVITTSCDKGYILPAEKDYELVCSVADDIRVTNCEGGCYVVHRENASIALDDDDLLVGLDSTYSTIHFETGGTATCKDGYVISSSKTTQERSCSSTTGEELLFENCYKGCRITETANAEYTDTDNLLSPVARDNNDNTITYSCADNTVTRTGAAGATSAECGFDAADVPLNECFSLSFSTVPVQIKGSSYIVITLSSPTFSTDDTASVLVAPESYTCTLGSTVVQVSVVEDTDVECLFNGLSSNTSYSYTVSANYEAGATWSAGSYSFTTDTPAVGPSEDGKTSVEMPVVDFEYETYDVIAVWFKNGDSAIADFTWARKRRSVELDQVYDTFDLLKASGDEVGAFVVMKAPKTDDSSVELDAGSLGLATGQTFVIVIQICEDDTNNCARGAGTIYDTPADHTVVIVVSVLVVLVVIVLLLGAVFVYLRRDKFPGLFPGGRKDPQESIVFEGPYELEAPKT